MHGMHSLALCPRTSGITGTFLHPRSSSPSFSTMISNIFFAWARLISCCGKKNCAIPYSLSSPISKPSFLQAFLKNLWEICRRIPTPSPVFPSASLPARCSRCSTILRAFATVSCVFFPLMLTTAPIPQLSCSNSWRYRPCSSLVTSCIIFVLSIKKNYIILYFAVSCFLSPLRMRLLLLRSRGIKDVHGSVWI